jgi:O-antigen ligase
MPEHLRALVVILVIALACFLLARRSASEYAMADQDFVRRRNLWFGVTLIAFLSHNFWIFFVVTAIVLLLARKREWNPIALFLFLVLALPSFGARVSGLGIINQLLLIDYARLLSLTILLPAALQLRGRSESAGTLYRVADFCVIGYALLQLALQLQVDTVTNTARYGVYAVLDVWLPYFVASRSLRDPQAFRDAMMSFVVACMIVATIAMFEYLRHWLLYRALPDALGASGGVGAYQERAGSLRAQVTAGHPIALGYVLAVALGVHLFIKRLTSNTPMWWLGFVVLVGGLVATVSRGPWIGAAVVVVVFLVFSPRGAANLTKVLGALVVVFGLLLISPLGSSVIDHLPFIGTIEADNITYRERLFDIGTLIVMQNPFFGSFDYLLRPEMQELKQGGMIDVVNSYLGVALSSGLVGLTVFSGAFVASLAAAFSARRLIPDPDDETRMLGNALIAVMVGIMLIIFTVSSITVVPTIYWTFIGLSVAYYAMVRQSGGAEAAWMDDDLSISGDYAPGARVRAS